MSRVFCLHILKAFSFPSLPQFTHGLLNKDCSSDNDLAMLQGKEQFLSNLCVPPLPLFYLIFFWSLAEEAQL